MTIGNLLIESMHLGNLDIEKIYFGQELIWEDSDEPVDHDIHGVFTVLYEGQSVTFTPGTFIENVEHKIDWGDGTIEDLTADTAISHTYDTAGEYSFTITGTSTIGDSAFKNCTGLTSITIPDSVTSIGASAFQNCSSLTSITISDSVTSIGSSAFRSCTGLTSITIPDSVTSIGDTAFRQCTGLTSVTIGSGVTDIYSATFQHCTGLTSVTIPDSVININMNAFLECAGLTSITIPNSVTRIAYSAFNYCVNLAEVIFTDGRTSVPTLANVNAFSNNASGRKFYVQSNLLSAWKAASNWSSYASYIEALPAA